MVPGGISEMKKKAVLGYLVLILLRLVVVSIPELTDLVLRYGPGIQGA